VAETPTCPKCGKRSYKLQTLAQCGACGYIVYHFACSTCRCERDRGSRKQGGALRNFTMLAVPEEYKSYQFCCCCGAVADPPDAMFSGDWRGCLRDGHEPVPDDLKDEEP